MPDSAGKDTYDHVWRSRTHLADRIGQALRVMIVGGLNSALVEFEDGHRCVTSCFGYCRITATGAHPPLREQLNGCDPLVSDRNRDGATHLPQSDRS